MEITVTNENDLVGWIASAVRVGEVYMTSVRSMVTNVLQKAGNKKITRLNILDHGNSSSLQFGNDRVNLANVRKFEPLLGKLKGHFADDGFVHLQHCEIGRNDSMMVELARIWDTTVYAGTGKHNPVYRVNTGQYTRAVPGKGYDGYQKGVGRPYYKYPKKHSMQRSSYKHLGNGAVMGKNGIVYQAGNKL